MGFSREEAPDARVEQRCIHVDCRVQNIYILIRSVFIRSVSSVSFKPDASAIQVFIMDEQIYLVYMQ